MEQGKIILQEEEEKEDEIIDQFCRSVPSFHILDKQWGESTNNHSIVLPEKQYKCKRCYPRSAWATYCVISFYNWKKDQFISVWSASLTSSSELSFAFKALFKDFDENIDNTVMLLQYEVAISSRLA